MTDLAKRLERLETGLHKNIVYPVTSPGSKGYYVAAQHFDTLEDVRRAFPGHRIKPVRLKILADLADL